MNRKLTKSIAGAFLGAAMLATAVGPASAQSRAHRAEASRLSAMYTSARAGSPAQFRIHEELDRLTADVRASVGCCFPPGGGAEPLAPLRDWALGAGIRPRVPNLAGVCGRPDRGSRGMIALNARACSTGKPCAAPEMIVRSAPGMWSASSSPSAVGVRMSWLPDTTSVGTRTSTSRSRSESSASRIARACAAKACAGTLSASGPSTPSAGQ